jgi:hypothetical protein
MVAVAVMVCLGAGPGSAEEAKKSALPGEVLLEIGHTGKKPARVKWAIGVDGAWGITRGDGQIIGTTKLTEGQQKALAAHFATMEFDKLPRNLGLSTEELLSEQRRYFVCLTFGKKRVILISKKEDLSDVLPGNEMVRAGGEGPKGAKPTRADWSRFVALTLVVKATLTSKGSESGTGATPRASLGPASSPDKTPAPPLAAPPAAAPPVPPPPPGAPPPGVLPPPPGE